MPPSAQATTSHDGTRIAFYDYAPDAAEAFPRDDCNGRESGRQNGGQSDLPVLLCVHGYPDNARLWEPVARELADAFRVVTYDVRGAGESGQPRERSAYHLDRLEDDFLAVLDAVSPDQPVHLLAHDWGSIQSWHFVTSERTRGRITSFVSISGPSLDHAGFFIRKHRPVREVIRQLLHSWYIYYFHLPWLPENGWRRGWAHRVFARLERSGDGQPSETGERSLGDYVNGLNLYRENVLPRMIRPAERITDVPVLAVSPENDVFVSTPLQTDIARWAPNLTVKVVRGGHWMPRNDPGLVARLVLEHTRELAR